MSKTSVVTLRLDDETIAQMDKLAKAQGRSRAWYAAQAVRRVVDSEADFAAFIQVGIDAADRGDVIPHEEVMAELDQMIAKHRAR